MGALFVLVRRIAVAAWRYRWAAVALAWIICGAGWGYVSTIPNTYEASARLYVDADAVLTPLLRGLALDNGANGQLDVLQRTLLSRPNLEKLVSNTDLDLSITGPADLETMVTKLGTDIKITPQTRNLFTIGYRNTSPKLAFDVVQTVLTTFIESKTGNNRSEMENAQLFINQQIADYERKLREAERKRAEFKAKYVDLLPADGGGGGNRLDEANATLRQLQGTLTDELSRRELINKELSNTSPLVETEAAQGGPAGPLRDPRVVQAEQELADLRLRYTENHPDVVAARNRLASLKASSDAALGAAGGAGKPKDAGAKDTGAKDSGPKDAGPKDSGAADAAGRTPLATNLGAANPATAGLATSGPAGAAATAAGGKPADAAARGRSVPNPIYEQLKVALVGSQATIASLQRRIADAQRDRDRFEEIVRSAPGLQAEYINLNRDYDILSKNYQEPLSRRESMRISTAADADADKIKIQVVDPPQVPQNPVAPKRTQLFTAVLIAGIVAGAGLAVLLVQFDQSFHTIDELRDLGLTVAGGVSLLNVTVTRGRMAAVFAFALSLLMLGAVYGGLLYRLIRNGA